MHTFGCFHFSLQQVKRSQLERLHFYTGSYSDVAIKKNSIIYCDIPYENTEEYDKNSSFDRKQFLDWAAELTEPVFISEYNISDSRFKCVFNKQKRSLMASKKDTYLLKTEKVYANKSAMQKLLNKK